ncbi:MAG: hypothetical protein EAZ42_01700 [Verrucomicrobia bacterium]|nr:MAG: hypothetical protein EAZ42_01700 [Verrucomicrobiota bacterium]
MSLALLFSCENATCAIPEAYREFFVGSEEVVTSTQGWEPGALNLAQACAMRFRTPLVHGEVTRLLLNYEEPADDHWSEIAMKLPEATRKKLIDRHWRTYRQLLRNRIAEDLRRHTILLHCMIHTSPHEEGLILLESGRSAPLAEAIAAAWVKQMSSLDLDIRAVPNSDLSDLSNDLFKDQSATRYAQIHLRVAQSFFLEGKPWRWETLKKKLLDALATITQDPESFSGLTAPSSDPR